MPYGGLAPTILTCAAVGFGEITSANCVGYYTVVCSNAYNLVPINLLNISSDTIALQDLVNPDNTANLTANRSMGSADLVTVYNGAGYTDFWLHDGKGSGMSAFKNKWVYLQGGATKLASESGLCDFKSGDCFFFIPKQTATPVVVTIPGQVPASTAGKLYQGYNLISAGYPCDFALNGSVGTFGDMTQYWTAANGFTPNRSMGSADKIMIYNGAGYTDYWLHDGKGSGMSAFKNKWVFLESGATRAVENPIPATSGFFFLRYAAGEIDFNPPMPYSLEN